MRDKLGKFRQIAAQKGVKVGVPVEISQGTVNTDRELIEDFIPQTQELESLLILAQENNRKLGELTEKQVTYEKSGELDTLIKQNNNTFVKIKVGLGELMEEIKSCEISEKQEPETRVKTTIHTALAHKLSAELRKT